MPFIIIFVVTTLLGSVSISSGADNVQYWCVVDDHIRPLPGAPPDGWYYNQIGGDRGKLLDIDEDPVNGVAQYTWELNTSYYKGRIVRVIGSHQWEFLGFWYSLGRPISEKSLLDPNAIFHPMILPAFQAKLTGLDILVNNIESPSGRDDLTLLIELKGFDSQDHEIVQGSWKWSGRDELLGGQFPRTFSVDIDPEAIGPVAMLTWILDKAVKDDAIEVDRVRLRIQMPRLSTAEEAFLISLAMILENYDDQTGMVQDRSYFPKGNFENVTATAKLAKLLAIASYLGFVDESQSQNAIIKIADTLLHVVPTGPQGINSLWPHFTRSGGTEVAQGAEWASGDTAYALLDLIVALQMIGDPASQLSEAINRLKEINWCALLTPEGGFYHGYDSNGTLLAAFWYGFGMETLGVLFAAEAAGCHEGKMGSPPSDNGSGFIYHVGYPIVPIGIDKWGNNWLSLRKEEVNKQINWYASPEHFNPFMVQLGLFGLSAAERPEGVADDSGAVYQAYGTGGKLVPANDGDHRVVVLHYSAMASSLNKISSERMWESLKQLGIISPLNNMESMAINPETGSIEQINYLKGSWNLCLQAEGWALSLPGVSQKLFEAFVSVPELALAYKRLFPFADIRYRIIVTSNDELIYIPYDSPQDEVLLSTETDEFGEPLHPVTADGRWLWFDAINQTLSGQNRRGLWRMNLDSFEVQRMTTDPWGSSYDCEPEPSYFDQGVIYLSNRTGTPGLKYTCDGTQGPGVGIPVYSGSAVATWSKALSEKDIAYVAPRYGSTYLYRYRVNCQDIQLESTINWSSETLLALACERLDASPDADKLLVSTPDNGLYLKFLPDGQLVKILPNGKQASFSPIGDKIAYVDIPKDETDHELYVAEITKNGSIMDVQRITYNDWEDQYPTWWLSFFPMCVSDLDHDGDTDGLDLAAYLTLWDASGIDTEDFISGFGNSKCQ